MSVTFDFSEMPIKNAEGKNDWYDFTIDSLGLKRDETYNNIVLLTKENSKIVENHIKNNPSYNSDFYKKMYEYYFDYKNVPKIGEESKEALLDLIRMIDLENSTNVWRYVKSRQYIFKMRDYIADHSSFWNDLEECKQDLVDKLLDNVCGNSNENTGPRSLASKVCRYLSELEFKNKDSYFVNDSVVRHVLPYYLKKYKILNGNNFTRKEFDNLDYMSLSRYLSALQKTLKEKENETLTKTELDHLMWYCYRNGSKE